MSQSLVQSRLMPGPDLKQHSRLFASALQHVLHCTSSMEASAAVHITAADACRERSSTLACSAGGCSHTALIADALSIPISF